MRVRVWASNTKGLQSIGVGHLRSQGEEKQPSFHSRQTREAQSRAGKAAGFVASNHLEQEEALLAARMHIP